MSAIAFDNETFSFRPGLQCPPVVCLQHATPEGNAAVEVTKDVADAFEWVLGHDLIASHHGAYDFLCIAEWYPQFRPAIEAAFDEGRIWDTMVFERLVEIALGLGRGDLGLDTVAVKYGLPPPTKLIDAIDPFTGLPVDVRTSFGLWYMQPTIPEPWHGYALYDGVATIGLQARQAARWYGPGKLIQPDLLAKCVRTHFARTWDRSYGLRVNPDAVGDLERVVDGAIARLREEALRLGFIRPKMSGRGSYKSPAKDPRTGEIIYVRDMKKIKAAVTEAYHGKPPLTRGGGTVSTSKDTLQDSGSVELETWAEYGEMSAARSKDLKLLQASVIHTKYSLTNSLRPISSGPNIANFRRDGFLVGSCECGYEATFDPKDVKRAGTPPCPACEPAAAREWEEKTREIGLTVGVLG